MDSEKEQDQWGGLRPGAGRKRVASSGELTRARTITLPESDWEWLEQLGGGNASKGARELIAAARATSEN